jgi:hypothetical protein
LTVFVAVAGEDASLELVRRNAARLVGDADRAEVCPHGCPDLS